jgi:hypothetical protein
MGSTWWHYRQWKFIADMNGDGTVSGADFAKWGEWLYYMPGDAIIAALGPTPVGGMLAISPDMIGSPTAAILSIAGWLAVFLLALYGRNFLIDAFNPTYRQQERERRAAEAARYKHSPRGRFRIRSI